MNYDVKTGIEALIDITSKAVSKVKTMQVGVNTQKSGVVAVFNSQLDITQANELTMKVMNYGYYPALAEKELNVDQTLVAQSIHDHFSNSNGFYTDQYLSDLFGYANSKVNIDTNEEKVTFDNEDELHEITMDEFLAKLVEDYNENKTEYDKSFISNHNDVMAKLEMIGTQLATNTLDIDYLLIDESDDVRYSQMNESIVMLSNKMKDAYDKLVTEEIKDETDSTSSTTSKFDYDKAFYIVIIIVGVCVFTAILIIMFTKPVVDAGISSVSNLEPYQFGYTYSP